MVLRPERFTQFVAVYFDEETDRKMKAGEPILRLVGRWWAPASVALCALGATGGLLVGQSQANASVGSAITAKTTPERVKDLLVAAGFTTCPPRPGAKGPQCSETTGS
jgi:hypothetical protein